MPLSHKGHEEKNKDIYHFINFVAKKNGID